MVAGRLLADQVYLAYSEMPWPWRYTRVVEARPERIDARRPERLVSGLGRGGGGSQQWQPARRRLRFRLDRNVRGLLARTCIWNPAGNPTCFRPQSWRAARLVSS